MEKISKEVDITYVVDFPRELVYQAWTNPEYLKEWFAPHGCTINFEKLEIREGGKFLSCISNPEFGDCWCTGEYLEVKAPEKLVYTMINADERGRPIDPVSIGMDPGWPGETLVTVTFEEAAGKTKIRLKQTVSEELAKRTGAHPSWIMMLERMEQQLAEMN